MFPRVAALAVLGIALFTSSLIAGIRRHDVPDANYLAVGNDPDYDSVGRVTFGNNSDWASGVLIAGRWFVTAGHVVRGNAINNTPGNVRFTVGGNMYSGAQIYMNPGFVNNLSTNGNDIAIVRLGQVVPNVDPAEMYFGSADYGATASLVGFGRTGTGLTGIQPAVVSKRGGTNVLDVTGNQIDGTWSSNVLLADFDQPGDPLQSSFGSAVPTSLEYLTAEKDSGAGVFIDLAGEAYLSGIVSFALFDTDTTLYNYGDALGVTDFTGQQTWILSVVPEVHSFGLLTASLLPLALARLWRKRA